MLLAVLMIIGFHACDKHRDEWPGPTIQSISEPGIVRFDIKQTSQGKDDDFQTERLYLLLTNQGQSDINNIRFSVRGYGELPKSLEHLIYWEEEVFERSIAPHETDSIELHPGYHKPVPDEKMEIDMISYMQDGEEVMADYSGSYTGHYVIIEDNKESIQKEGRQMTWVDFEGNITVIFDRDELPWCTYRGRILPSGKMYGAMTTTTSKVSLEGWMSNPPNSDNYKLHFDFEYETDTIHNYHFSLTLNKN
jgi:hypothetical protein